MRNDTHAIGILRTKSLPAAVKDEIVKMIISGQIEPGQKLTEMDLAEQLGVSRGPIREALLGLEEAGLISIAKNRGVFVREVSASEARELYELREALEVMAGRRLVDHITPEGVAQLRAMIAEMDASMKRDDMDSYFPQNVNFHDAIVEMAGNAKLLQAYRRLINEMHLMRRHEIVKSKGMANSVAEHIVLVDALESRSPDAVEEITRRHVRGGQLRLINMLRPD